MIEPADTYMNLRSVKKKKQETFNFNSTPTYEEPPQTTSKAVNLPLRKRKKRESDENEEISQ